MARKIQIWNFNQTIKVNVPTNLMRICAQCLLVMPINHYFWVDETHVDIVYLCEHPGTSRFKSVHATLDRLGRLS